MTEVLHQPVRVPEQTRTEPSPEILGLDWSPESFDSSRIDTLVGNLIPNQDCRGGRSFGVHIVEGSDEASDIARFIESTVFDEYFDNDVNTMKQEYSQYDPSSTFLLVLDYDNVKPVGVVRLIKPSAAGLKSLNDLVRTDSPWYREGDTTTRRMAEIGDDPNHTIDIGTMAVMPNYRSKHAGNGASAALYSTCVQWSIANGYNYWVTIVDKKIYTDMQSWGEPFQPFDGAEFRSYLDSPASLPVHLEVYSGLCKVKKFDEQMTEALGQPMDVHGLYTRGTGLEQQFVLPEWSNTV